MADGTRALAARSLSCSARAAGERMTRRLDRRARSSDDRARRRGDPRDARRRSVRAVRRLHSPRAGTISARRIWLRPRRPRAWRKDFPRTLEPPVLPERRTESALPLAGAQYRAAGSRRRGAGRRVNDAAARIDAIKFGSAPAPTPVTVSTLRNHAVAISGTDEKRRGQGRARVRQPSLRFSFATMPAPLPANGSGGGYSGPLAYRQGKPMRPDVAAAFDGMAAAARAAGHLTDGQQRVSLGRRAGEAVRCASRSEVGRAAGDVAASLRDRTRPRSARRIRLARGERAALRVHQALRVGAMAFRIRRQSARRSGAVRARVARADGRAAMSARTACRLGCRSEVSPR